MKHVHYTDIEPKEVGQGAKDVAIRWLITKEDGAKKFAMRLFEVRPRGHTPYHSHDFEHEIFVFEGTGSLKVEGRDENLRKGDVILLPANIEHQLLNHGEEPFLFLCLIPHTD